MTISGPLTKPRASLLACRSLPRASARRVERGPGLDRIATVALIAVFLIVATIACASVSFIASEPSRSTSLSEARVPLVFTLVWFLPVLHAAPTP